MQLRSDTLLQEFHLETMARANQNVETSSVLSMESTQVTNYKVMVPVNTWNKKTINSLSC